MLILSREDAVESRAICIDLFLRYTDDQETGEVKFANTIELFF